jgi:hypothetical protein
METVMRVNPSDRKACRACQADIIFAQTNRTSYGQPVMMPVDAEPSKDGNVFLSFTAGKYHAGVIGKNQAAGMRDAGQELHTAHFKTCPDAARFRKHYGTGGRP